MAVTPQVIRVASAFDLETQVNAYFASLFGASSVNVLGVTLGSRSNVPFFNANFSMAITTDATGAKVQASPYQFTTFTAPIEADALTLCRAFIAANPTFFFSQIFSVYRPEDPDPIQGLTIGLFFCSDKTNATDNWRPISSGSSGGPAGGDLSGTYPNPTVVGWRAQPLDPVTMAAPGISQQPIWDGAQWAAAAPPNMVVTTGVTVWVDSVFGNDATGLRQRQDKPFLTIKAAVTAASSGDTVYVRPGTYAEGGNSLSKGGITIYCPAGVTITYTNTLFDAAAGTFNLRGEADLVKIGGAGSGRLVDYAATQTINLFFRDHIGTVAGDPTSFIRGQGATCVIFISCRNIQYQSAGTGFFSDNGFAASSASSVQLYVSGNFSNTHPTAAGAWGARGSLAVNTLVVGGTISCPSGGCFSGGSTSTSCRMVADTFTSALGLIPTFAAATTLVVRGRRLIATASAGVSSYSGTNNFTLVGFASISGTIAGMDIATGTVTVLGMPVISGSAGPGVIVGQFAGAGVLSGSACSITGTTFGIQVQSGTCRLKGVSTITGLAGPGVSVIGGTLNLANTGAISGTSVGVELKGGVASMTGVTTIGSAGPGIIYDSAVVLASPTNISFETIQALAGNNPGISVNNITFAAGSPVTVQEGRIIGSGTSPALAVGAAATSPLTLSGCTLLPGAGAANSITSAVPYTMNLNTSCSSTLAQDANTTLAVTALTVDANVQ